MAQDWLIKKNLERVFVRFKNHSANEYVELKKYLIFSLNCIIIFIHSMLESSPVSVQKKPVAFSWEGQHWVNETLPKEQPIVTIKAVFVNLWGSSRLLFYNSELK